MNDHNSLSTTDDAYTRPPYFELSILRALNLSLFSDCSDELLLYVQVQQNNIEWETSVGEHSGDSCVWDEMFELDIDMGEHCLPEFRHAHTQA